MAEHVPCVTRLQALNRAFLNLVRFACLDFCVVALTDIMPS